ncbi:MAG TPA: hypothetical protein VMC06_08645, partial [Opitutaceae bacterium]|nr:hypothetical protein [Opitutaceae bacterium]
MSLASQTRSFPISKTSPVAKYFTLLGVGLPSGLSNRAATNTGTSCVWQFSTQATCSAVSRADS